MENKINLDNFVKIHPEFIIKKNKVPLNTTLKNLCRCRNGHLFDYRHRKKFEKDNQHYAPCQGMCPECGNTELSLINGNDNFV